MFAVNETARNGLTGNTNPSPSGKSDLPAVSHEDAPKENTEKIRTASVTNSFYLASPEEVKVETEEVSSVSGDPENVPDENLTSGSSSSISDGQISGEQDHTTVALQDDDVGDEQFSGNEFYIRGENIASVTLHLDRDGLYQVTDVRSVGMDGIDEVLQEAEEKSDSETFYAVTSDNVNAEDAVFNVKEKKHAGQDLTLTADELSSDAVGFYIPPEYTENSSAEEDPKAAFQAFTDYMDGGQLDISVTYTDGSTEKQTYDLRTGKLKVSYGADGMNVENEFTESEDEPSVYGVLLTKRG